MSGFEVSVVERAISGAMSGDRQALNDVQRLTEQPEWFCACLRHFCEFANVNSRKFTLVTCRIWCATKWNDITLEMKQMIRNVLFSQGIEAECTNLLSNAQFAFFFRAFPNEWPSFWEDIGSLGESVLLNFLGAFCAFTDNLHAKDAKTFSLIKNAMRSSGQDKLLLEFALHRSFLVAGSLLRWASVDNAESVVGAIIDGLNSGNAEAVDTACALVERGMDQSIKMALINALEIPARVMAVLQNKPDIDTMRAIARLVVAAALQIPDLETVIPFFQVSLPLMMNEDIETAGCVAYFVQEHVKARPEISGVVMNTVYARIKDSYEDNVDDVSYRESLFDVVRSCFAVNPNDSLEFLLGICESIVIVEEMSHCVALLEILGRYKPQPEFVRFFVPLLELPIPLSHEQALAVASYTNFFKLVAGEFGDSEISNFFTKMASFAVASNDSMLSRSLLSFTKRHRNRISVDNSIICGLVATFDPNLATTSAVLIRVGRHDLFSVCLAHLSERLQTDASAYATVLSFVKTMHYEQGSPYIPVIKAFLEQIIEHSITDDDLQALFVRTCFAALGGEGLHLIARCAPIGCLSTAALCKVTLALQNKEAAVRLIGAAFEIVKREMSAIEDVTIVNDEVRDVICMLKHYFLLVSSAFVPDLCGQVCLLAREWMLNSQVPEIVSCILSFAASIAKTSPSLALDAFLEASFASVLTNPRTLRPGWSQLGISLIKFHSILITNEGVAQAIGAVLKSLQATDEMVMAYLSILSMKSRARNEAGSKFLSDFYRFRVSLT